ncbi:MAG: ABC transporter permease [Alicyclobacillus herbarius]|uniref:ABC transporter permease n=1 Tax=Alicyclobacillus herbarius TaxID=122960 RepID=UPI00047E51A1|nr:ABC transporter permease [Alicyclobacillus herbarius]MCL6632656.1 ABC transporter permease [Alicyclobacillus herbarius]
MNLGEMLLSAWTAIRSNKLRSFLTMLGILIGVSAIIAIVALGQGGQAAVIATIESPRLQNTIQILPKETMEPGLPQPGQILSFSDADFALARQFPGVADVYYTLYGQATVASGGKLVNVSLNAGPQYLNEIARFTVVQGRMFNATDVLAHRRVVLVSTSLAEKLFKGPSPLGETIQIGGQPLQVIGVAAPSQMNLLGGFLGTDYVYMPATTCRDLFPWWSISEMDVQVDPGVNKVELGQRIVTALNIRVHNANAFEESTRFYAGLEQTIGQVTRILTLVIGSIAGIALVVGGVGVMNIMLVSVTERTQEIGIRISLGATRRAILLQFLMESVLITLIGGVLGVLLGGAVSFLMRMLTGLPTSISGWAIAISLVFSTLIGLICGLYPANKAARLNPIDALRYE